MFPNKHDNFIKSWGNTFSKKLIDFATALNDVKVNSLIVLYNNAGNNNGSLYFCY